MVALPGISIKSKIYESSNSLVHRGIREDGQAIIIKLLKQDYPSPQEIKRYRQEYAITRSLNIDGVIKAYSQQDYQRTLVILLEDFGAESLEYWMRQHPETFCPMPVSIFLPLAIDITRILGRIHAAHIIHKDINPGNIVLNPDTGVVKIIDFGIATQFNRTNSTFKSPHVLEGTSAYLSPEQTGRMNRSIDYRTDFYSLGATFYELLTGQLPFPTTDILELVHCHIAKQPVPLYELNAAIPQAVSDIILKLMAKNAEDRYQSAWGIKADLEHCATQLKATGHIVPFQLGLQDVSDQFQIPQKLYGREAEIAVLLAAFERVAGGTRERERGDAEREGLGEEESENVSISPHLCVSTSSEMILVSGYAGVGKSALVQELYKPITAKRGYFVSGKFDQLQRNIPYSAIAHALKKLVQQLLGESDEQLQQWRSRLLAALGSNGQLIIDVIPEVELIIGRQPSVPEVGGTEAQNRFNRVFQQFVRAFCFKEHPLVIFLDDLQWIDSATLKLIELMLLDEQTQALFLIGAYRDNEVTPTHPLALKLEELRKQGAVLQEIVLAPLTLEPLSQLIAETLYQDADIVGSLAQLVMRKTEGNPFFVGEFLQSLYSENLLSFNAEQRSWQWNLAQIEAQNITDNVVDLLLHKLKKLPEVTQHLLQLAACIGCEFDLATLAFSAGRNSEGIVCEKSPKTVFQDLLTAIQTGFIQPLSELDEDLLVQEYKFLHDRVQQAAYTLIDEPQKQIVHLQIGRDLLEKTLPEQLSDRLFEIVDHLNHGIELVTDQSERDEVARLNLMAGQKAKGAIAYSVAKNYLAIARKWLTASWETNYELTLELYIETAEVEYLCGDYKQVESWVAIILKEAKFVLDIVKAYEVKIQTEIAQNQRLQAINTALQVLQQLEISFPEKPSQLDIHLELDTTASLLNEKPIEDLIHLPEMIESNKLAAMRILSRVTLAARHAASDLWPLLIAKQVNLSIQYGNSFVSPFAYASYGLVLCGIVGDIEAGYQFGQLALRLLSQPNTNALKARTLLIVNNYIIYWKEHVREILNPLLEGHQSGLETGDLEFAAFCAYIHCAYSYFAGKTLTEVEQNITTYSQTIRQIKQETALMWCEIFHQIITILMSCSTQPHYLIDEFFNQNKLTRHKAINDVTSIFIVCVNKLLLYYLFSDYSQAVENSAIAERYVIYVPASFLVPLYYFYSSLARLVTYPESSAQTQAEILNNVASNQEKMKHWADHAPMNFLHKYHLVEAEKARVLGQLLEAEKFYEQAIQGARENEYIQEEALAYELAAKHYLARGLEKFAHLYVKEAHYCYERWGATAKVKDLETRYPQFFLQPSSLASLSIRTTAETTSDTSQVAFDLATVMKASQAISNEIELEQLLHSLMQILIENAGAQTGYLLLETAGEWKIEAACELYDGEQVCSTQVLQSLPMTKRLPESIINYVIRTHESIVLNDATRGGNFINDPYIQQNQPQSLLCSPLLNQSKLVGVLYLENQLATGVFNLAQSQILNLLSTQAAIAIENAKLYSEVRVSKSQMTQFLEAVPVGIAIFDAAGRPYYFNQRATQLVGKESDPSVALDQLTQAYQVYLAGTKQQYPTERLPSTQALSGKHITADDMEIYQNGTIISVEVWGTPVFDEHGNVAYAIAAFQDVTERKQAEQLLANYNRTLEQQVAERTAALQESEAELRHREQELRLITDALPALVSYVDANLCYQFVNRTYEVWFSRSRDEILGKSIHELLGETAYQVAEPYINQALAGQVTTYEAEIPYPFGKKHIAATFIPDFDSNDRVRGFYGLVTDIGDRKRAEEASILDERNRMAREIHDTLAQAFTGILLHVGAAIEQITKKPATAEAHMKTVDELARTGLTEARRSVSALRPKLLEKGDLFGALKHLAAQMKSSTNAHITCEIKGIAYALSADVENHLLRIGQEALTNAIKYARATEIYIELVYENAQCLLRIKDDGQGFEVNQAHLTSGFGLLGMSERVEQIGGELIIYSQPNQGTEITVIVNWR